MEQILKAHEKLEKKANLGKAIDDVQSIIDKLKTTRNAVTTDPSSAPLALAKLQTPIKQSFEKVNEDLTDIYKGLNAYSKALEKKFERRTLPFTENNNALSAQPSLVNRAIAMHLLREGHFDVATSFISEVNANPPSLLTSNADTSTTTLSQLADQRPFSQPILAKHDAWDADFSPSAFNSTTLQQKFTQMYHILHELRNLGNLAPAIEWARQNSSLLEARGSNLEYDLCRLQYINLFTSPTQGPLSAIHYARATFPHFPARYATQTQALVGALAFTPNLATSPYAHLFASTSYTSHTSSDSSTTAAAATAFTSEFCALLSLSSASPLLTAVTAGCIALPTLVKFSQIQQNVRTSWTTAGELPFEVQLPSAFSFHSVFVCPVSKEQSTDANPPMMMPCGHVVAKESLEKLSKGARFKCPYCPAESHLKDAKQVFL